MAPLSQRGTVGLHSPLANAVHSSVATWAIDARGGGVERAFQGDIRDVGIWNVARGQEAIRADMNRAPRKATPGLVGYWPLNERQGTIARDVSAHQNHGLIRGAEWGAP